MRMPHDQTNLILAGTLPTFQSKAKSAGIPFAAVPDSDSLLRLATASPNAKLIVMSFFMPTEPAVDLVPRLRGIRPAAILWIATAQWEAGNEKWSHLCDRIVPLDMPLEEITQLLSR